MSQMIEFFLQQAPAAGLCAQPVEMPEVSDAAAMGPPLLQDPHPLHAVKVTLHVRIGESAMTVGELLSARANQVLLLDREVDDPVDLLLEGRVVARGQLVAVDGSFAVRITELPVPLKF